MEIFDDLESEEDRLEEILTTLDAVQWAAPSAAAGWSVADVVLHLAQTEEAVIVTVSGAASSITAGREARSVEELAEMMVREERSEPGVIFDRWRTARVRALRALRKADPDRPMPWAAAPLKPRSLATTRLAEHWAHGLDITDALGIAFADTERLRHVAWLAHRSLPYSLSLINEPPIEVYSELEGPTEDHWCFGPPDAPSKIRGPAGAFCRVGARRLDPVDSGLSATGPHGALALRALRNYAF